jgi:hypothetical protein
LLIGQRVELAGQGLIQGIDGRLIPRVLGVDQQPDFLLSRMPRYASESFPKLLERAGGAGAGGSEKCSRGTMAALTRSKTAGDDSRPESLIAMLTLPTSAADEEELEATSIECRSEVINEECTVARASAPQ